MNREAGKKQRGTLRSFFQKIMIYIVPELMFPGVFAYYWWESGSAGGWGGWAYGVGLGLIASVGAVIGMVLLATAFIRKHKRYGNWHWLTVSAGIVGSPALFVLSYQAVR